MTKSEKVAIALIKKAIELKRAGLYCLVALMALSMSACAGIGFKMEGYRIDQLEASQKTFPKPLKCLFTSCPEWDTQKTGEGS